MGVLRRPRPQRCRDDLHYATEVAVYLVVPEAQDTPPRTAQSLIAPVVIVGLRVLPAIEFND